MHVLAVQTMNYVLKKHILATCLFRSLLWCNLAMSHMLLAISRGEVSAMLSAHTVT